MIKVAFFDTHAYEKIFFDDANRRHEMKINYLSCRLNAESAWRAKGSDAVCAFVNDELGEITLRVLKAEGIRLVALRCAGFDNVDMEAAARLGIQVVRVPSYSPHSIAEHATAMILNLARKISLSHERVHRGKYSLDGLLGFELFGKTVGVVGTGAIGSAFCKIMNGFGCKVKAFDLQPNEELQTKYHVSYTSLDHVLHDSDIISLHIPLNESTRHWFGAEMFGKMKPGCVFVNTGRGALIQTEALIDALKSRKISYAALDVYEKEAALFFQDQSDKILQDDLFARLLSFQNVLITPHQAFFTEEAMKEIASVTLRNIKESILQSLPVA